MVFMRVELTMFSGVVYNNFKYLRFVDEKRVRLIELVDVLREPFATYGSRS